MRLKWLPICLTTCLVACAAPSGNPMPQTWVEDSENGELIIYRTRSMVAVVRDTYFYVDGVHVASLGSATYAAVKIPPGSHRLSQKWDWDMLVKDLIIDIPIAPQQKRYVRLTQSGSNTMYGSPTVTYFGWELAVVPEAVAESEMKDLEAKPAINSASRLRQTKLN